MDRVAKLLLVLALCGACSGRPGGGGDLDGGTDPGSDGGSGVPHLSNADVYERLKPSCEGCHAAGASRPMFATLTAFENLIAYDPRYVVPGAPDRSELIRLLIGTGAGAFRQMPPSGDTFAVLETRGQTRITVEEVRRWIAALQPRDSSPAPRQGAPRMRRKTAEQIVRTLSDQLGLSDAQFFATGPDSVQLLDQALYPLRSPDAVPFTPEFAQELFRNGLGGPGWLKGNRRIDAPTFSFFQTFVPLSQAWCRLGVEQPTTQVLLRHAAVTDRSADAQAAGRIRENLRYLHLRLLGELATEADVEDLFQLFVAHEPPLPENNASAWTAVCSALVRDPLWLTY